MQSFFYLTLDTTAPSPESIQLPAYASSVNITATLSATGANYMKIWGDICASAGGSAIAETDASWVAYDTSAALILTATEGTKFVYVKFKDDVGNESASINASVILDTSVPVVTIVGPDVGKISKVTGYNISSFTFSATEAFDEWTVRAVPTEGSARTAGAEIPMTNGSINMHGNETKQANTSVSCEIHGADLDNVPLQTTGNNPAYLIKVFVKDLTGNWSN